MSAHPRPRRSTSVFTALLGLSLLIARSAGADAPRGHFVANAGVVADAATQLKWQQSASSKTYTWATAKAYCTALDLGGKGWRLPTTKELQTLVDETRAAPAIDPIAFPGTASDYYWTSSRVAGSTTDVWAVSFRFGFDGAFPETTKEHVRCVR